MVDLVVESRHTLRLRAAKGRPRIPGPIRGTTIHYNGPALGLRGEPHLKCQQAWRAIQKFHMDDRGWWDVAYTDAVCHHGIVLAGRGEGVRTAANGTDEGNNHWYALFALIGDNEGTNAAMLSALRRRADQLAPGGDIVPHHHHKATRCPGPALTLWTETGAPDPYATPEEDVVTPQDIDAIAQAVLDKLQPDRGLPIGKELDAIRRDLRKIGAALGVETES